MAKPRKFVIAGDSHGDMQDDVSAKALGQFLDDYRPEIRVHLGDAWDLRNLRKGASDEEKAESLEDDWRAGDAFLRMLFKGGKQNYFLQGNHDMRLWDFAESASGLKRDYALYGIERVDTLMKLTRAKMLPYDSRDGVLQLGELRVVHGYHCGVSAAAVHARIYGNVVFGHVHSIDTYQVPGLEQKEARSIGCMCRHDMGYINQKTAKLRWAHGWAFGWLFPDGTYQLFQTRKIAGKFHVAHEIKSYG
jgi:predicted phosphodiesterase